MLVSSTAARNDLLVHLLFNVGCLGMRKPVALRLPYFRVII